MKPPGCDDPPAPLVERVGPDGVVYVELSTKGSWESHQRPRSYPRSLELLIGALSLLGLWLSTITGVVSLAMKFAGQHEPWTDVCAWSFAAAAVCLVVSLSICLTKKCPLCHGTPLHARRCRKHRLADRWAPLTHRATTVLRLLTTLHFRCMYCGTPFRLFKKSSRTRR